MGGDLEIQLMDLLLLFLWLCSSGPVLVFFIIVTQENQFRAQSSFAWIKSATEQ
jgi:hypothetical protein